MITVCISDLHGYLPEIPDCDVLIIAGDICPVWNHQIAFQRQWLNTDFRHWLSEVPAKQVAAVAGNHDLIFEQRPDLVPDLPWQYLQDSSCYFDGLKIYGLPWQRTFNNWAFNLDERELDEKYRAIPDCDIIISHGPAFGYGDTAPRENGGYERVGNKEFVAVIEEIKPKLVVTGHIHSDPGKWDHGPTRVINATLLNDAYQFAYPPRVYEL